MKKIRIILGALALVLAGVVTYAQHSDFAFVNAYYFDTASEECILVANRCTDTGTVPCTITIGTQVKALGSSSTPVGTTCGTQLLMPKP